MNVRMWRTLSSAAVGLCVILGGPVGAGEQPLLPRPVPLKPDAFRLGGHDSRTDLVVKFREGLSVSLVDGVPVVNGAAIPVLRAPAGVAGGRWARCYRQSEARLNELRRAAQHNLHLEVADPNLIYRLRIPQGSDAEAVVNALNGLDVVEIASPSQLPAPPPLPPSFQSQQLYIEAAPPGIGAVPCWSGQGIDGQGVRIGDVEYNWILTHLDLPAVTLLPFTPVLTDPSYTHHGCAVLGILGAKNNGWGTTGLASGAQLHAMPSFTQEFGDGVDLAIYALIDRFGPGDVMLIEQQVFGDVGAGEVLLPVELFWWNREAIMMAVGNGIVVVEAAANGGVFLDPHIEPFHPQYDTGALIVGAGAAPPPYGSQADASRLSFSNFGPIVDLQGWGQAVRTTGYGQLWSSEGVNLFYTNNFSGTSSAAPMVAAAAALLQSAALEVRGTPLTPAEVRTALRATGTPQPSTSGQPAQNIGPRPDAEAAILSVFDCDDNGVIDSLDIAAHPELDCNRNGLLDSCEMGPVKFASDEMFPFGAGFPKSYTIANPPAAGGSVTLQFIAASDFGFSSENVAVSLNGTALGTIFQSGAHDCAQPPDQASIVVAAADWNLAVAGGSVVIGMTPSAGVDPLLCPAGSFVKVKVSYPPASSPDADGNGVLDACETPGVPADLDGDGDVDGLDLATLLGAWGRCPAKGPCAADLNGDHVINGLDLAMLLGSWG